MGDLFLLLMTFTPLAWANGKSVITCHGEVSQRTSSVALRGYMALMILCLHDLGSYYLVDGLYSYPYPFTASALRMGLQCSGFLFVGIFFALSAYGCRQKWAANPHYLETYLPKRMISVWVPFVLIGTTLGLLRMYLWGGGVTFRQLFLNCFDANVWPVHWYIIFVLLFYVSFYCVYSGTKSHPDLIMCGVILCYLLYCYLAKKNEVYYVSHIGLLVGILWSKYGKKLCEAERPFPIYWAIIFVMFLFIYNYPFLMYPKGINIALLNNGSVYRMLSVCLICISSMLFLHFIDLSQSRWLTFLGGISMELYLVQSFAGMMTDSLRAKFEGLLPYTIAYGVKLILTVSISIILSLIFQKGIGMAKKYMLRKYRTE